MAAPRHVPVDAAITSYTSPDVRPRRWTAARPGDLIGQPSFGRLGHQGPDQGYAYGLVGLFDDRLFLHEGESRRDVDAGCVAVALKRASLFGRAPVVFDLEAAYTVFGFLDDHPPAELVERRTALFEGVAEDHHYSHVRELVACVQELVLALSPAEIGAKYSSDPLSLTSKRPTDEPTHESAR